MAYPSMRSSTLPDQHPNRTHPVGGRENMFRVRIMLSMMYSLHHSQSWSVPRLHRACESCEPCWRHYYCAASSAEGHGTTGRASCPWDDQPSRPAASQAGSQASSQAARPAAGALPYRLPTCLPGISATELPASCQQGIAQWKDTINRHAGCRSCVICMQIGGEFSQHGLRAGGRHGAGLYGWRSASRGGADLQEGPGHRPLEAVAPTPRRLRAQHRSLVVIRHCTPNSGIARCPVEYSASS